MGALDKLSTALQGAVAWTFEAATLTSAGAKTVTPSGGVSAAPVSNPCKARVNLYKRGSAADGYYTVTELLILAGSLAGEPVEGNTLTVAGKAYKLGPVVRDGIRSHWRAEAADG